MPNLLMASTVPAFLKAFLFPFADHFREQGWRVDAMANGIESDVECRSHFNTVWDVRWSRNPLDMSNFGHAPSAIRKITRQVKYDIVHVHTPVAGLVCRFALRHQDSVVRICTAHGFHFHEHGQRTKNAVFLGLEKLAGRWTDILVVINRSDEAAAKKHRLVPSSRLVYMPGIGVDTQGRYHPRAVAHDDVLAFRETIRAKAHDPVVLMLAEFIPRKRHVDALHAWRKLGCENAHLVFAGCGPTEPYMRQLTSRLGLQGQVHFLGMRSDVPTLVRASQAVLLCSDQEGLPRSVMESLSLGTPVIGSDIRGTRELLSEGAGYLYPVRDVEALAQVLRQVLANPIEASTRATAGQRRMASYDLRHIIRKHEELYSTALSMKGRTALLAS